MAPSAVETTTIADRTLKAPVVKATGGIGAYKELATYGYAKEAEADAKVFEMIILWPLSVSSPFHPSFIFSAQVKNITNLSKVSSLPADLEPRAKIRAPAAF
jgi:hypothetical protein